MTGFTPTVGETNALVIVHGENFDRSATGGWYLGETPPWGLYFGDVQVPYTRVSEDELRFGVPNMAAGSYRVSICWTGGGVVAVASASFVIPASMPTINITNQAQYDIVSIVVNGFEQLQYPETVVPGGVLAVDANPGTTSMVLGLGTWTPSGGRSV